MIASASFEFEKVILLCSFLCDMCRSSNHKITSCPFHSCYLEHDLSLPLAQCTGFKVGGPFGLVAKFDVGALCCELEGAFVVVHNLVQTPLEVSCDENVHEDSSNPKSNYVISNPLIILMSLPCVHRLHCPLSILLICPLIIMRFIILMLIRAIRIT